MTHEMLNDRYTFLCDQLEKARKNYNTVDAKLWNGWGRRWNEKKSTWEIDDAPRKLAKETFESAKAELENFVRDLIKKVPDPISRV